MSLEDMIATCISHGVRNITLGDYANEPGYGEYFCAELYDRDPWRIVDIPKPWAIEPYWVGFGEDAGLSRLIPFRFSCGYWRLALYDAKSRMGLGIARPDSLEADLHSALGNFLCDGEGAMCPHAVFEFHGECGDED
jgi:hypothetical protein